MRQLFTLLTGFSILLFYSSCETESVVPEDHTASQGIDLRGGQGNDPGNGKGKGKKDKGGEDDSGDTGETVYGATYQLYQQFDYDPLYKFSISESGDLMLLQTDPTVTTWGTNYWGSWEDPFPYINGVVNYIKGLTNVTYTFDEMPNGDMDVNKILIVQPYSTNLPPDTTYSHPGIYRLVE